MATDLTFRDLVTKYHADDARTTALDILRALNVSAEAIEVLLGVVSDGVRTLNRASTRDVERIAFTRETAEPTRGRPPRMTRVEARSQLVSESFALADGRTVAWGVATVADHEQRVQMLRKLVSGYNDTIERHLITIKAIEAAGVTCYAEVEKLAAA